MQRENGEDIPKLKLSYEWAISTLESARHTRNIFVLDASQHHAEISLLEHERKVRGEHLEALRKIVHGEEKAWLNKVEEQRNIYTPYEDEFIAQVDIGKLDVWLRDARHCGLHAMRSFVGKLRQDIDAVRNAILEPWSNGQVEGQINRLKTLKRAMYGRASVE